MGMGKRGITIRPSSLMPDCEYCLVSRHSFPRSVPSSQGSRTAEAKAKFETLKERTHHFQVVGDTRPKLVSMTSELWAAHENTILLGVAPSNLRYA